MNELIQKQSNKTSSPQRILENGELTLKVASTHFQESPMSDEQKMKVRETAPSLYRIFEETLKAKGEYNLNEINWNGDDELEMEYLSQNALHTFILEAEKLGKKITYNKSLTIKISD